MENQKIAAAFVAAKRAFTPALKDKTNPAFRSKYADLGACIDAVNEALLANGIALMQETFLDDTGVTVETVFLHESGECLRGGKLHVPAVKQDPQGYGSAATYCRRYSLMAACGIAPEDDDGNAASSTRSQARNEWLKSQFAAIDAAKTSGELKQIVAAAIAVAQQELDEPALLAIQERANKKIEAAKPKTVETP